MFEVLLHIGEQYIGIGLANQLKLECQHQNQHGRIQDKSRAGCLNVPYARHYLWYLLIGRTQISLLFLLP